MIDEDDSQRAWQKHNHLTYIIFVQDESNENIQNLLPSTIHTIKFKFNILHKRISYCFVFFCE